MSPVGWSALKHQSPETPPTPRCVPEAKLRISSGLDDAQSVELADDGLLCTQILVLAV